MLQRNAVCAASRSAIAKAPRYIRRLASTQSETTLLDDPKPARRVTQVNSREWRKKQTPEKQFEVDAGRDTSENKSALLRLWQLIPSMADAMAVIRHIERAYGPVAEFKFFRDINVAAQYQSIVRVRFQEPEGLERIMKDGVIHVPLGPPIPTTRPGGISLEELDGLNAFQQQTHDPEGNTSQTPSKSDRIVDARVIAEGEVFTLGSKGMRGPRNSPQVGKQFIAWGGFAPLKPIPKGTAITHESHPDRPYMRLALRKWADRINMPNPYETKSAIPVDFKADAEQGDWEPLTSSTDSVANDNQTTEDAWSGIVSSIELSEPRISQRSPSISQSSAKASKSDSSSHILPDSDTSEPVEPVSTPPTSETKNATDRPRGIKPKKAKSRNVTLPGNSLSTNRSEEMQHAHAAKREAFEKRIAAMSAQAEPAPGENPVVERARKDMPTPPSETTSEASSPQNGLSSKLKNMFTW